MTSALRRARARMEAARSADPPPPVPGGPEEQALLDRLVSAFTDLDVDELVALMTDDVWVRMPPLPFEYRGTAAAHRFFTATAEHRRMIARMVPVRANRQPGWGEYVRDQVTGGLHLAGVLVVGLAGNRVSELTHFETTLAPLFGLPRTLD